MALDARLTVEQRRSDGRGLRQRVPLEAHADVVTGEDRPDPVAILAAQDESRLADLVPIRHGRMRVSPFTFFRGGAAVMASDLSRGPVTDLRAQLCGDAHLSNFGVFKAADRRLVFDVNDFDETAPGPFEWDVKRLAASVAVAGRGIDLNAKQIRAATRAAVRGYRETIHAAVSVSPLELRYFRVEVDTLMRESKGKPRKRSEKFVSKAARKDSMRALEKLTSVVDGRRVIHADPPVVTRVDDLLEGVNRDRLASFFEEYLETLAPHRSAVLRRYRFSDMAHKVVGVGSVGTRCLIVLLESDQGTPLFLQFKEATRSVLEDFAGDAGFDQAGERVVQGQRLMQSAGDILLGWSSYAREDGSRADFYFRQLWDGKGSFEIDEMGPLQLKNYVWHCGATLALAHARTGDAAMISGYLGDDDAFDHVLAHFAERYADVNEADHATHERAIQSGIVAAMDGV